LLNRLIDYQMFSILLVDQAGEKLQHRFAQRFEERLHLKHDVRWAARRGLRSAGQGSGLGA